MPLLSHALLLQGLLVVLRKVTRMNGPSLTLQIPQVGRMHTMHRYLLDVLCTVKVAGSVPWALCLSSLLGLLAAIMQALQ